jgi:hypothetical protein
LEKIVASIFMVKKYAKQPKRSIASCLFYTRFLHGFVFSPEDGGDMFLRNVGYL